MRLPKLGKRARIVALGYGLALFLWMSVEDNAVWPVALYGLGLATLILYLTLSDKMGGKIIPVRYLPLAAALWGALMGLSAGIAITVLMFFKNALHAHLYLDYPPGLILAILQRAPIWAVAGGLAGIGFALAWLALGVKQDDRTAEEMAEETA
jgi:hypothetical protein